MKYINSLKSFTVVAGLVTLLSSCEKTLVTKPIGDAGSTYLKIPEAPENPLYFTPFSDVKTVTLFSVRKDANSNKSLNTPSKGVLTSIPGLIDTYNTDNGTNFEQLPDSIFALQSPALTKTATGYELSFEPGDFAKEFTIGLNGAKWDVSHSYAVAFSLSSNDGGIVYPSLDTVIAFLSVKNEWDAIYTVTGWFFHPSAGRAISMEKHLATVNASRVQTEVGDLGSTFQFDVSGTTVSNFASDGFTSFNMMTADNPGGTDYSNATNEGHLPGDANYEITIYSNTYDPATQTFYLHYGYRNGAVGGQNIFTRQIYEKWVRKN